MWQHTPIKKRQLETTQIQRFYCKSAQYIFHDRPHWKHLMQTHYSSTYFDVMSSLPVFRIQKLFLEVTLIMPRSKWCFEFAKSWGIKSCLHCFEKSVSLSCDELFMLCWIRPLKQSLHWHEPWFFNSKRVSLLAAEVKCFSWKPFLDELAPFPLIRYFAFWLCDDTTKQVLSEMRKYSSVSQAFSQDARCLFTFGNCQVCMSKWPNPRDYIISLLTLFHLKMTHFQKEIEFLRYIPLNFNECCSAFLSPMFLPILLRRNKGYKCLPYSADQAIKFIW